MVYGVALGPGDPELLTIKALRILQESDVIFYPGSTFNGVQKSFVYPLLEFHNLRDKDLRGFYLEMSDDRSQSKKVYETTAFEIQKLATQGKKVVIVCEGDMLHKKIVEVRQLYFETPSNFNPSLGISHSYLSLSLSFFSA